jgi:hypothetical protein
MTAPASICLLRTSAIGDVTHVVPLVRTLQQAWPQTSLSWIVGKLERKLVGDLPGVNFVTFDKTAGRAGMRAVHDALRGQRFGALLQMQVAMRSNILSLGIKADRRIGYDKARARDLHGLVINERIPARTGEHVLDAIGSFCEPLGLKQTRVRWDIPIPEQAHAWAATQLPGDKPVLLVSPCSSHALRNWRPERYSAVIDHAASRGWSVALTGGAGPDRQGHLEGAAGAAGSCAAAAHPRLRPDAHGQRRRHPGSGPACGQQPGSFRPLLRPALVREQIRRGGAQVPRQTGQRDCLGQQDRKARGDGPGHGGRRDRRVRALRGRCPGETAARSFKRILSSISHSSWLTCSSFARSSPMSVCDAASFAQVALSRSSSLRTLASLASSVMRRDLISRMVILSINSP